MDILTIIIIVKHDSFDGILIEIIVDVGNFISLNIQGLSQLNQHRLPYDKFRLNMHFHFNGASVTQCLLLLPMIVSVSLSASSANVWACGGQVKLLARMYL